jgi:hypothetical protein
MRTIILTESQFRQLMEITKLEDNVQEYPKGQIGTTTNVHDENGDVETGEQPDTDKFARIGTRQDWWRNVMAQGGRLN